MSTFITTLGIGALICILGIINMTGNISTIHYFHRSRVSEAEKKPFGRLVGIGTIIIGLGIITLSALNIARNNTGNGAFTIASIIAIIVSIIAGMLISFYAMIKYNKGIF